MSLKQRIIEAKIQALQDTGDQESIDTGPGTYIEREAQYIAEAVLDTLSEANFYPEIGDVAEWNGFYWEINSVTEPQLIGGHTEYKHQIKANAHRIRLSSLQIEEIRG